MEKLDKLNVSGQCGDEELCRRAAANDADAEETLVKKYGTLVRVCARPYFLAGGDSEDLFQEGMLGLLSAIRHYEPGRDVPFRHYAETCIKKRLYDAIKSATRAKQMPLNTYISLESPQFDETTVHPAYYQRDPEDVVIARERTDEIKRRLYDSLSKFEREILALYLEGMSYKDMSVQVNRSAKSVDNAVQRIRQKLSRLLSNGDISGS